LLSSNTVLAAPNMMYRDGTYFLATEVLSGNWMSRFYTGSTPLGPFSPLPGSPQLMGGSACPFQTPVDSTLYCYTCQQTGGIWTVAVRTANLQQARPQVSVLDPGKWNVNNLDWSEPGAVQRNGTSGRVAQSVTYGVQALASKFAGTDYVLEGQGRQLAGRVWGFGVRTTDASNSYSLNLYEDLDGTDNLYLYRWNLGHATTLWSGPAGPVNPNAWYKLGVKVHGSSFEVYLNDVLKTVVPATDPTYTSGGVALYGEAGTTAQYDDVRVRKYATAEPVATTGAEQMNPPVITSVQAAPSPLGTGATVAWTTDRPATSVVHYGLGPSSLDSTVSSAALVTSHLVTLANLVPGTTYHFRVSSEADSATASSPAPASPPLSFVTPTIGAIAATQPVGACLVAGGCVGIPVRVTRADATAMRSYRVRVRLSPIL
jgi:hypothetical protein